MSLDLRHMPPQSLRDRRPRASMLTAERIAAPMTCHGEGPFWDARGNRLLCVDLLAGAIVAINADGDVSRYEVPSPVASVIRRRASGGFVVATERGIVVADDQLSVFDQIAEVTRNPGVRTNDGGCDRSGGFVIGTMGYDERPGAGAVYRLTPDHQVVEMLAPVSISNGVQWSTDGTRAYYIDSPTRRVDVFDVDPVTGYWSGRRPHLHVDAEGVPDGMAVDEEDGLWVALWGGGAVNHYDAAGRLVETVLVPGVTQVSSCAFGGHDRRILYVTTSRVGLPDDREPDAGAVFAVTTGTRGAVEPEFAG